VKFNLPRWAPEPLLKPFARPFYETPGVVWHEETNFPGSGETPHPLASFPGDPALLPDPSAYSTQGSFPKSGLFSGPAFLLDTKLLLAVFARSPGRIVHYADFSSGTPAIISCSFHTGPPTWYYISATGLPGCGPFLNMFLETLHLPLISCSVWKMPRRPFNLYFMFDSSEKGLPPFTESCAYSARKPFPTSISPVLGNVLPSFKPGSPGTNLFWSRLFFPLIFVAHLGESRLVPI